MMGYLEKEIKCIQLLFLLRTDYFIPIYIIPFIYFIHIELELIRLNFENDIINFSNLSKHF